MARGQGFSRKEAKANNNNAKPSKSAKELTKQRDARKAADALAARQKAAKTVTGNPSHYQQSSGRGASARGRDGHHGD